MGTFTVDLERFKAKSLKQVDMACRKIALTAYRRIILRTPVDTGRARGNWVCTIGSPAMAMSQGEDWFQGQNTGGGDKSGRATVATMQEAVTSWKPLETHSIFLANNLPYIGNLEHGSSRQAPNGMVAITVAELGGIAADAGASAQAGTFGGSRAEVDMGGAWDIGGGGE